MCEWSPHHRCIKGEMKMHSNIEARFIQLLEKLQEDSCTLEELYELEAFLEKEQPAVLIKEKMYQQLSEDTYPVSGVFVNERTFDKIKGQIKFCEKESKLRTLPIRSNFSKVAAIVILSFVLGGLVVNFLSPKPQQDPVSYCEVVAPMGTKSQVFLPDSTIVWLNAGSRIKYSTDFNKTERNIALIGEGYFKVTKNKQLPFVVNALDFLVEAVGTEFNIQAYKDEETIKTVLVEGKVRLDHKIESIAEDIFLIPNSLATFYKNKEVAIKNGQPRLVISNNIDPYALLGWKDNRLIFKSELLEDLVVKLSRMYEYIFKFESEDIKKFRFSGTIEGETIEQVMEVIKITSPISYTINGNVVTIEKDDRRLKNFE